MPAKDLNTATINALLQKSQFMNLAMAVAGLRWTGKPLKAWLPNRHIGRTEQFWVLIITQNTGWSVMRGLEQSNVILNWLVGRIIAKKMLLQGTYFFPYCDVQTCRIFYRLTPVSKPVNKRLVKLLLFLAWILPISPIIHNISKPPWPTPPKSATPKNVTPNGSHLFMSHFFEQIFY